MVHYYTATRYRLKNVKKLRKEKIKYVVKISIYSGMRFKIGRVFKMFLKVKFE